MSGESAPERQRDLLLALGLALLALGALGTAASLPHLVFQGLGTALFLGLLAAAGVAAIGGSPARRLGLARSTLRPFAWALLPIGVLLLSHGTDSVIRLFDLREASALQRIDDALRSPERPALWLMLLSLAVAPGIAEELLFRGLIQRWLTLRLGPVPAIGLASVLFALAHADPVHAAGTVVLGLYLGTVSQVSGSVLPAIVCHVVNNLAALLAANSTLEVPVLGVGGVLLALAAAALLLAAGLSRRSPRDP